MTTAERISGIGMQVGSLISQMTANVVMTPTDYYIKLTNLQSEYRRIGVNYNQAVKALHTGLSEKKALAMLYKLEQLTIELISLNREIIRLTQEFEQWLQK